VHDIVCGIDVSRVAVLPKKGSGENDSDRVIARTTHVTEEA
jgi:hypothetical protein